MTELVSGLMRNTAAIATPSALTCYNGVVISSCYHRLIREFFVWTARKEICVTLCIVYVLLV